MNTSQNIANALLRPPSYCLLGPKAVASWLGVSASWVRIHAIYKQPRLKSLRIGKLLRFRPEDIEEFLETAAGSDGFLPLLGKSPSGRAQRSARN